MCIRDNLPCALCGLPIDYNLKWPDVMAFTADHIIPWSKLPPGDRRRSSLDNLQPAHVCCNSSKGNGERKLPPIEDEQITDASPWEW